VLGLIDLAAEKSGFWPIMAEKSTDPGSPSEATQPRNAF